ncbi:formaldehyde dismutase [Duganella sp. HH105]|nr:formaldehyde dismutase [Duganella sp. HH105]
MRALVYHSAHDVKVDTVPDPVVQQPDDIILKITATAICGSDLHLYRGKVPGMKEGDIMGHEFMGVVVETGPGVTHLKKGDRVVVPFVIACGSCFFCDMDLYSACETTNPDRGTIMNKKSLRSGAALFGFSHMYGGVPGGQAEYVRVPKANVGPIKIPDTLEDEKVLFLSDILPTGYQAVLNAAWDRVRVWPSSAPGRWDRWRPLARACWGRKKSSWSTITITAWSSRGPLMA